MLRHRVLVLLESEGAYYRRKTFILLRPTYLPRIVDMRKGATGQPDPAQGKDAIQALKPEGVTISCMTRVALSALMVFLVEVEEIAVV
jgi:hypothetical protein